MLAHEIQNFEEILTAAEGNAESNWDCNFCADMREKYDQFGDEMYITEKQVAQLERISGWFK